MYIPVCALAYFELAGSEAGARWCGEFLRIVSDPQFSKTNAELSSAHAQFEFVVLGLRTH